MAESVRPPVAVRVARPYDTEEAFLEHELETVGKTSVILIGAQSRPNGVILRFEVTLANGTVLLRGEGRVLAYKDNAFRGQAGLALRFTRLDPKSKAFVDRAAAVREARLAGGAPAPASSQRLPASPPSSGKLPESGSMQSAPVSIAPMSARPASARPPSVQPASARPPSVQPAAARPASVRPASVRPGSVRPQSVRPSSVRPPSVAPAPPPPSEPVIEAALTAPTPPPPPPEPAPIEPEVEPVVAAPAPEPEPPPAAAPRPPVPTAGTARFLEPHPDRGSLLARLRQRASEMTPEQKAAILRSS